MTPSDDESISGTARTQPADASIWLCALFLVATLGALFYPMFRSGFQQTPGDLIDARFNNYSLEHTYLWLIGRPDHRSLWDSPVGYPQPNMVATSEDLFGSAPVYWLWRGLGAPMDTAFDLWLVAVTILDFFAMRGFLRRALQVDEYAAGLGSFLFCAAAARVMQLVHAQLSPQFFSLWALSALIRLGTDPKPRYPALWWVTASVCVAAQLWAGFYLGWFLILALIVCGLWALVFPEPRRLLVGVMRRDWLWVILAAAVAALLLQPLVLHSLEAVHQIGWRPVSDIVRSIPKTYLWVAETSGHYAAHRDTLGATTSASEALTIPAVLIFVGAVSLISFGFWRLRARAWMLPGAATAIVLMLLATRWRGDATGWLLLRWFPGWAAIRAIYRIVDVTLIAAACGVAGAVTGLARRKPVWATGFALLVAFTQLDSVPFFPHALSRQRVAQVVADIPKGCGAFYAVTLAKPDVSPGLEHIFGLEMNLDAMLAQAATGIPTVNSYFSPGVVAPPALTVLEKRQTLSAGIRETAAATPCLVVER
jgi:hypothetical protein